MGLKATLFNHLKPLNVSISAYHLFYLFSFFRCGLWSWSEKIQSVHGSKNITFCSINWNPLFCIYTLLIRGKAAASRKIIKQRPNNNKYCSSAVHTRSRADRLLIITTRVFLSGVELRSYSIWQWSSDTGPPPTWRVLAIHRFWIREPLVTLHVKQITILVPHNS